MCVCSSGGGVEAPWKWRGWEDRNYEWGITPGLPFGNSAVLAAWVPEDHLWCQIRLWIWNGHQEERWWWHCVNGASLFWNSTSFLLSFLDLVSANLYFPRDMDVDAEGQEWMCLLHGVKQWDHNVWMGQEQSGISLEWVRHYQQFSEHPRTLVFFSIQSKILC